jgi:Galactose oxidase, central domain
MQRAIKLALGLLGSIAILCGGFVILHGTLPPVSVNAWLPAGNLAAARAGAASVLLQDGRLLITGGNGASGALATTEILDPTNGFIAGPQMNFARANHVAVLLQDGRVLVAGGTDASGNASQTAELFDPVANSWSGAGPLMVGRSGATATLLASGQVLIAGGTAHGAALASLEIFDPNSNTFTSAAGVLSSARENHAAALLPDGRVLIAGGWDGTILAPVSPATTGLPKVLASTDIFDPTAGTVSPGPALAAPRMNFTATAALDGSIVAIGGTDGQNDLASIAVLAPGAGVFALSGAQLTTARQGHLAFLLPHNGNILVVGGTSSGAAISSAELYTPWTGATSVTGAMASARSGATGSPLFQMVLTAPVGIDGALIVAGGLDASSPPLTLPSAEVYGFATVTTDKADYAPGDTVNISGSGWQPGEVVQMSLVEVPDLDGDSPIPLSATADANGNFSNITFPINIADLNIRFTLTAVGGASQAQTTFTDAVNITTKLSSCSGGTVTSFAQGDTVCAVATGLASGNHVYKWFDPSSTQVRTSGSTSASNDSYTTTTSSPTGTWTVGVYDSTGTTLQNSTTFTLTAPPDLKATKTDNVGGSVTLPTNNWIWSIKIENVGGADASFGNTIVVLHDDLPSGLTYSALTTAPASHVSCAIASSVLTCSASGALTIAAASSFTVSFTATDTANTVTSFVNPTSGVCAVDPTGVITTDANALNNSCSDTVTVASGDSTPPTVVSIDRSDANPTSAATVHFAVTFSESVTGVDSTDFSLATTGAVSGASITGVSGSGASYTVTVATGTGDGTIGLNLVDDDTIQDLATNKLGGTGTGNGNFTGQVYDIDKTFPTVSSIVRAGSSPTNATSVDFTVTFSKSVTGVDTGDFSLATTGAVSGASISGVSGSGAIYTVTVGTGTGDGTIGLNLVDNDSIQDAATNKLGGTGAGNGNFTGEVYTIDKTPPTVSSIVRADSNPTNAANVHFTVTFSESVTGVDTTDFSLATTGAVSGASISGVSGSGAIYTVTVATGTGDGTIGLNLVDDDSVQDLATNKLGGTGAGNGNFTGEVYTIDKTPPVVTVTFDAPGGSNDWHVTAPVSGSVSATDPSNVASISCTDTLPGLSLGVLVDGGTGTASRTLSVTGEGKHEISCQATDGAGNGPGAATGSTSMPVEVKIDTVAPTLSLAFTPNSADGDNGWWKTAAGVPYAWTCSDATSGIDSTYQSGCPSPLTGTVTAQGTTNFTHQVRDQAGNLSAEVNRDLMLDNVKPTITLNTPVDGASYTLNAVVHASFSCSDATSGITTANCVGTVADGSPIDTATVGSKSFTVSAKDNAGNMNSTTVTYNVQYNFIGFLPPIANGVMNAAKGGQTIPVKWQLRDASGTLISDLSTLSSMKLVGVACSAGAVSLPDDTVDTTGGTVFRFDGTQFIYNWKTSKGWNGCLELQVTLNDGTVHSADFQFK